jgi:hypothetical protein
MSGGPNRMDSGLYGTFFCDVGLIRWSHAEGKRRAWALGDANPHEKEAQR